MMARSSGKKSKVYMRSKVGGVDSIVVCDFTSYRIRFLKSVLHGSLVEEREKLRNYGDR
jgi:hypothetical protein